MFFYYWPTVSGFQRDVKIEAAPVSLTESLCMICLRCSTLLDCGPLRSEYHNHPKEVTLSTLSTASSH